MKTNKLLIYINFLEKLMIQNAIFKCQNLLY